MFVFKHFLYWRYAVIGVWGALAAMPATAATSRDDQEIQQWLTRHARQAQAVEVAAARHRVVGDLDGDGRIDAAVLYTLKPRAGRGESRYLAAFKRQRESPSDTRDTLRYHAHVLVSGPGAGEANRVIILDRTLVVEMLTFGPGDASCCPTQATRRRYRMAARGLVLVKPDAAKRTR